MARHGNNRKLDSCHIELQLVFAGYCFASHWFEEIACCLQVGAGSQGHEPRLPALVHRLAHALMVKNRMRNPSAALHLSDRKTKIIYRTSFQVIDHIDKKKQSINASGVIIMAKNLK